MSVKPDELVSSKVVKPACPQCHQLSIVNGKCWVCGWPDQIVTAAPTWSAGKLVLTIFLCIFGAVAVAIAVFVAFFAICIAVIANS